MRGAELGCLIALAACGSGAGTATSSLHLEMVWVTNGYFTGEVPAAALDRFQTPP